MAVQAGCITVFIIAVSILVSALAQDNVKLMKKVIKKRDMSVFHDICLRDRGGLLDDWMFQYASLHGLARNKRMTAKFDSKLFAKLKKVFKFPLKLVDSIDVSRCQEYEVAIDKRHSTFDRGFVQFIQGTDPVLLPQAHLQSWFYFYNCVKQLRQEFVFVDSLIQEAKEVLDAGLKHARAKGHISRQKPIFIGLIVNRVNRGVDYNGKNAIVPSALFYRSAMNYYEQNFKNVLYMVYAEDETTTWAKNNLQGGPFVFMESKELDLVLAVMGQCQHMIISPGSLSFWAAFLANGETIYYKRAHETENTQHYSYHKMDYYLPYWRPMEE